MPDVMTGDKPEYIFFIFADTGQRFLRARMGPREAVTLPARLGQNDIPHHEGEDPTAPLADRLCAVKTALRRLGWQRDRIEKILAERLVEAEADLSLAPPVEKRKN